MKRLKALIFVLVLTTIPSGRAAAQWAYGQPVLDMRRLYQIVGAFYNIDPDLLQAIATAESNGNPGAVSPKGAEGLMQLMPDTARRYRVTDPFDPVENVLGAARFLYQLRAWSQFQAPYGEVDLPAMIAAYNAGPGAVEKYGGIPPYEETQAYVRKVLWLYLLGQPPPRPLNLAQHSPQTVAAHAAGSVRSKARTAKQHTEVASGMSRPISVFDQLAEIRRKREEAKPRDMQTRAALHIN
jgi:Transglycosylase SLT domain